MFGEFRTGRGYEPFLRLRQWLPKQGLSPRPVQPGSTIQVQTKQGEVIRAKVVQVVEDGVVIDINHPLAGETLNFEVRLVGLEREE